MRPVESPLIVLAASLVSAVTTGGHSIPQWTDPTQVLGPGSGTLVAASTFGLRFKP